MGPDPSWTFLLTGISRSFSHQFVRHRVGFSFSQLSQQYHDESDAQFVRPFGLENFPEAEAAWRQAVSLAQRAYSDILKIDAPISINRERMRAIRSAARSVLPNATATAVAFSANARSLRHFLSARGNILGDAEMRHVSALIFDALKEEPPTVIADFRKELLNDGLPTVSKIGFAEHK